MDNSSTLRIALYYVYTNLSDCDLQEHVEFHTNICKSMNLTGRIRVSPEGINGVLSGDVKSLEDYEYLTTEKLGLENGGMNIKYCLLRDDIPPETQIFDELTVKKTKFVISLFDSDSSKRKKKIRRRRQQRHWQQQGSEISTSDDFACEKLYASPASLETTDFQGIEKKMMAKCPAEHLSPEQWHKYLAEAQNPLLLDCRNVYESRVGYFSSNRAPTLLTNTRKYSDLPLVLANNCHLNEKKEIFMYCTGGVRCERVSMLVQCLYPEKKVFQLDGGIQSYLERQSKNDADEATEILFKGKNFVFDPRRVDPVCGPISMVGKCIICETPHDDYDNGHAPSEKKEARCNGCRMLILICNSCRSGYACWGEDQSSQQRALFCGIHRCIHEGASPEPELITSL